MSLLDSELDQLLDERDDHVREGWGIEDFIDLEEHPLDCSCERCVEDRELF